MRWLDSIVDAMNMNLGKLWETGRDSEVSCAAVHGVTKPRCRVQPAAERAPGRARRDAEPQREGALLGQESAAQRKYRLRRAAGQPQPRRAGLRCRPGPGATMRAPGARGGPGSPRSRSCSGAGS